MNIHTYTEGPFFVSSCDITKKNFIKMLDDLAEKFNDHYETDEYRFSPEEISEGGIVFDNFHDKENYKTMRLYFVDTNLKSREKLYGWITENVKTDWADSDEILIPKNKYLGTFLKTFRNAPPWNSDDLKIFMKCFHEYGIKIKSLPHRKDFNGSNKKRYYLKLFGYIA